ncbi:uncharacterized protein LOC111717547 [Eurytemora carolleeae]|uniref:uncharacterized protein LOC111717547 n=1 Tax=Eurytemora carolleeae TaxID=1294199 RepID=UPI000C76DDE1|nr:uncharacterized protein LOC111717547 [Eurytemora carolleeae]|eukprot:XP_023348810.1 uncharacterized protein LOC111717547 [Eurytemora affinis]
MNKIVLLNKNIFLLGGPAVSSAGSNLILGLNPSIASLEVNQGPGVSSDKNPILGLNPLFGTLKGVKRLLLILSGLLDCQVRKNQDGEHGRRRRQEYIPARRRREKRVDTC